MEKFTYQWVKTNHSQEIAQLAICLTEEIMQRTNIQSFTVNLELAKKLCHQFLEQEKYAVIAAFHQEQVIGFGALCESFALYAEGAFGILQEFYVLPEYRSQKVGYELLEEIKKFAKQQNWTRIELCTPPVPEFERTVEFYQDNGFSRTGGYKMRYLIDL